MPEDFAWQRDQLDEALRKLTAALRPWTIDFHVAQNDGDVKGSGSHDKTGHHCLPTDPNGKLDIVHDAGYWLRDESGKLTKAVAAHLLGWLHVPQCDDDEAGDVEQHSGDDDRGAGSARVELVVNTASSYRWFAQPFSNIWLRLI